MREQNLSETEQFKRILRRNLTLPLAIGASSAAIFLGLMFYLLSVLDWVDHTQAVIGNANELTTLNADLQGGLRGFALTGEDRYLSPYSLARPKIAAQLPALMTLVADNPPQVDRLVRIRALQGQWESFAQDVIGVRRRGTAIDPQRWNEGQVLYDEIRREFSGFVNVERQLLKDRSDTAHAATTVCIVLYMALIVLVSLIAATISRRQTGSLGATYGEALRRQLEGKHVLEAQAWLRAAQSDLAEQMLGQQSVAAIGRNLLTFLARTLDADVGAFYVRDDADHLQRVAAWGFDKASGEASQTFKLGEGLVGQAASDGRVNHVRQLTGRYFKVASGLGEDAPAELVLAPVNDDGRVNGVVELGFMHALADRDLELLRLVAAAVGAAVQAARYRSRLQDTLEETHQLNEELQTQQEELRTANEELEEQSRALMESQNSLEQQHTELEQSNSQLAAQALVLDRRNDALNDTQAELRRHAEELQRASRYKSEFLANMSHELRTPLNSSLILAKLLAENRHGNLNAEQLKFAETIYSAGNDLLNLINDILDLSKVEAGKMELSPEPLRTAKVLESLKSLFDPLAREKHLAFETELAPDTPPTMFADRQRLEQVLKNLLSNALKFTEKGTVRLAVRPAGEGRIAFAVSDSGIGIPPDQVATIFEAFRQADGTINRRFGGTGLGLSISREFAALLGGGIAVESKSGEGSTFTLELPVQWSAAAPKASAELAPPPAGGKTPPAIAAPASPPAATRRAEPAPFPAAAAPAVARTGIGGTGGGAAPAEQRPFADDRDDATAGGRTVLVVEDDPTFAGVLYELAREAGYRCIVAHRAEEGFELAERHLPDAILLDVRLPDGSGLGVLQRLKEHRETRHIPVHIVAGEDFTEVAMHLGAVGFAIKPATREELQNVFAKLEETGAKKVKRVLLVEDDARQRDSVVHLIGDEDIDIAAVERGEEALDLLRNTVFDCMIIDLKLPDMDGSELLERMTAEDICSFPPVIVYTGRNLTREEEASLNRYSRSIIIKGARSPERLLDEVTLFLHKVESQLSAERQTMLKTARSRDKVFEGRKVLLVDDDVRNIFALTSALEQKGLAVEVGRNGFEAIARLDEVADIDLVLMDVMMPGMDGLEATRRIRADARFQKLPIIAITAKAMKDDQEQCRQAGTNDYLAKPIELDRLFSLLRVWMPSVERF